MHIVGASPDHLEEAVAHIAESDPGAQQRVHTHPVDLGNLKQTIALAQKLAETLPRLDMLYLIAGIGVAPFGLTADGIGNHFAVNNLCQVAIVDALLPLLRKTAEEKQRSAGSDEVEQWSTRVVSESSELHRACPSDAQFATLEEMTEQSKDMDPTKLYGRSKTGQWVFSALRARFLFCVTSSSSRVQDLADAPHCADAAARYHCLGRPPRRRGH